MEVRDATAGDLDRWDAVAVDGPGGSVWQSLAWAEHAALAGWRPRRLLDDAGVPILALLRPWPVIGGASAYIPRGPVAAGDPPERVVARLEGVVRRLAADGVDVVATDAEIPAATGYGALLRGAGFAPIEELMPSRDRMAVPLDGGIDGAWERIAKKTRQRIGSARRRGLIVRRFDAAGMAVSDGADAALGVTAAARGVRVGAGEPTDGRTAGAGAVPGGEDPLAPGPVARPPTAILERAAEAALGPFHQLLEATGTRRGFAIGPRERSVAWWLAAMRAGHLAYLEVRDVPPGDAWERPEGVLLGGAVFFRQGGRLTYGHSGDRVDLRGEHPGVVHLLLWEAMGIAVAEGRTELDLGGVDVAGSRGMPAEGDPMWGLYEFKRAFGGAWVELSGAHERVLRPRRYGAGRATAAALRRLRGARHG